MCRGRKVVGDMQEIPTAFSFYIGMDLMPHFNASRNVIIHKSHRNPNVLTPMEDEKKKNKKNGMGNLVENKKL